MSGRHTVKCFALLLLPILLIHAYPKLMAQAAVSSTAGEFTAHPTIPRFGGDDSEDVALGDVDLDGDLDALVANVEQPETVWLNDGTGAFTPHPTKPSFETPSTTAVALGDVNGDHDLDALVANREEQAETVWLNNGAGVFTPHPTAPGFGSGYSHGGVLGDIDGDGDLDAIITQGDAGFQRVWLNNGSGTFTAHPTIDYFGDGNSTEAVLGDVDGDGDLDALASSASYWPPYPGETVWLNDGTGVFKPIPQYLGRSMAVARQPGSGFAEVNGARLYYEVAGSGDPMVMVHAGVADRRMSNGQWSILTEQHTVVRYDMRGFGQSASVDGAFSHHEDLYGLLEFLGIAGAVLIGCSRGGAACIDMTLDHPDRTRADPGWCRRWRFSAFKRTAQTVGRSCEQL